MTMWLWIQAFTVESEILRNAVDEAALTSLHGRKSQALLVFIHSEYTKHFLLLMRPRHIFQIHLERSRGIWHMFIQVIIRDM